MTLSADDRIELHELVARYGSVVDDCDLDALGTVYTEDARFTLVTASGREVHKQGLAEIGEFLTASNSTNAHILTNITTAVEDAGADEQVILRYRMGAPKGADLFSIDYRDVVVRIDAGWRIADHTITMRPLPGS